MNSTVLSIIQPKKKKKEEARHNLGTCPVEIPSDETGLARIRFDPTRPDDEVLLRAQGMRAERVQ